MLLHFQIITKKWQLTNEILKTKTLFLQTPLQLHFTSENVFKDQIKLKETEM